MVIFIHLKPKHHLVFNCHYFHQILQYLVCNIIKYGHIFFPEKNFQLLEPPSTELVNHLILNQAKINRLKLNFHRLFYKNLMLLHIRSFDFVKFMYKHVQPLSLEYFH